MKGRKPEALSPKERYTVRCIEDYANGISKEVDLVNEMNAAKELAKVTKQANVAVPIEAKSGIYVMERAKGISVQTLRDYYSCKLKMSFFKNNPAKLAELEKEMERIKSRAPEFNDIELSDDELKKLLYKYVDILTEQFSKINRGGKTIHADIHPGNVIIDLDIVKGKTKGKMFTLIDTGNVVRMTKEESLHMLNFTKYIQQGNYKELSRSILEGAVLPEGMTKEQALKKVEEKMKKCFFDNETGLEYMTTDNFFKLSDAIFRDLNIISANTQLNIAKAKNASGNSLSSLADSFFKKRFSNILEKDKDSFSDVAGLMKDGVAFLANYLKAQKLQEFKNLFMLSPSEWFKGYRNAPARNSEDFLMYNLKQNLFMTQNILEGKA